MKKIIPVLIAILFAIATTFALIVCISLPITLIAGKAVIDDNTCFEVILSFAWLISCILNTDILYVRRNIGDLSSVGVSVLTITITLFVLCLIGMLIRVL